MVVRSSLSSNRKKLIFNIMHEETFRANAAYPSYRILDKGSFNGTSDGLIEQAVVVSKGEGLERTHNDTQGLNGGRTTKQGGKIRKEGEGGLIL